MHMYRICRPNMQMDETYDFTADWLTLSWQRAPYNWRNIKFINKNLAVRASRGSTPGRNDGLTASCDVIWPWTWLWRVYKEFKLYTTLSAFALGKIFVTLLRSWRVSDIHYCSNEWCNEHALPWPTLYLRSVCYLSHLRWPTKLSYF